MLKKRLGLSLLSAIISVPVLFYGCGTETESNNTKTSSLTLSASFKTNDGITSQFISNNVKCIEYTLYNTYLYDYDNSIHGTLTPSNPSVTLNNLVTDDEYYLYLVAYDSEDCNGARLDELHASLSLTEGSNTFTATMIGNAKWEFVDSNNNPAPIVLNKTNPNSNETLNYFLLTPYAYRGGDYIPQSIDETKFTGATTYRLTWIGSNLPQDSTDCTSDTVCYTEGRYLVQFIGPNQSNNAFGAGDIELSPYTDANGTVWNRNAFIVGTSPGYDINSGYYYGYYNYDYNLSLSQNDGTDVVQDLFNRFPKTTVVSANRMEGILLEVATNQSTYTENYVCAWDENKTNTFTCPQQITATGIKVAAVEKLKTLSSNPAKQSIDSNNCYNNASLQETFSYQTESSYYATCNYVDLNGDGATEWVCDYNLDGVIDENDDTNGDGIIDYNDSKRFYVFADISGDLNICVHPFTAIADEIPSSDVNLVIQSVK